MIAPVGGGSLSLRDCGSALCIPSIAQSQWLLRSPSASFLLYPYDRLLDDPPRGAVGIVFRALSFVVKSNAEECADASHLFNYSLED